MTKDIIWVNLENPSLEAAIEIEDRNQLMLGFTENLPEAIRAFDASREPVYTDEPRRDLFDCPRSRHVCRSDIMPDPSDTMPEVGPILDRGVHDGGQGARTRRPVRPRPRALAPLLR